MAIQPSHAQNPSVALVHVEFHGHSLITFLCDGEPYAAMRPICEGMGLVWNGQYERIQRNEALKSTIRVIRTVAADGKTREVIALPLKLLNGWLFGVDVSRVKPELRETILAYQRECYDTLYRHWHREPAPPAIPAPTRSRLLLTLEGGKVVQCEPVPDDAQVCSIAYFRELAALKGFRLISPHNWLDVCEVLGMVGDEHMPTLIEYATTRQSGIRS